MGNDNKKLARNLDLMLSAEMLKQLYDELLAAGFERGEALEYMAILVSKFSANKDKRRCKDE